MKFNEEGELVFSSGRTYRPNGGIVGLGIDPVLEDYFGIIHDGYDTTFPEPRVTEYGGLSRGDYVELAEHMVKEWKKVAEKFRRKK